MRFNKGISNEGLRRIVKTAKKATISNASDIWEMFDTIKESLGAEKFVEELLLDFSSDEEARDSLKSVMRMNNILDKERGR